MQYTLQEKLDILAQLDLPVADEALLYLNTDYCSRNAVPYLDAIENTLEGMYKKFILLRATCYIKDRCESWLRCQRRPLHKKLKNADLARIDNYLKENMPDYDLFSRWFDHDDCTSEFFPKDDYYVIPTYHKRQPIIRKFKDGNVTYDSCLIYNHHADRLSFGGDHSEFYAAQLVGKYGYHYGVNYTDADASSQKFGYSQMKLALEKLFTSKEDVFNNPSSFDMPPYMRLLLIASNAKMYSIQSDSRCSQSHDKNKLEGDNLSFYNEYASMYLVSHRYSMYREGVISYNQLYKNHCVYVSRIDRLFFCNYIDNVHKTYNTTHEVYDRSDYCKDPKGMFYLNERTCKLLQQ